jgi:hypothetical protein
MANVHKLKNEFDEAKQALLSRIFDLDESISETEVQAILDRMSRVFNELLISTLEDIGQLPQHKQPARQQELLCVYAVNAGDGWSGSQWEIAFVNGVPIDAVGYPLSVRDFTRQMVANGWKAVTSPIGTGPTNIHTPDGKPIYELYFCRDLAGESPGPHRLDQPPASSPPDNPNPN